MQQLFEIKLKARQVDIEKHLSELSKLGWSRDGDTFRNMVEGQDVVYLLDIKTSFSLKCMIGDLFLLDDEEWDEKEYPYREEIVRSALEMLKKMPFDLEVESIERKTMH